MPLSMPRCLDDIEVCVGEPVSLYTLEEPPERRGIGHIRGLRVTRTAGKHATDTATDVRVGNY
jgi:hypothetical protein